MADSTYVLKDERDTCLHIKVECADGIQLKFRCPFCKDVFKLEEELRKHIPGRHPDGNIDVKVKQERYYPFEQVFHLEKCIKTEKLDSLYDESQITSYKNEENRSSDREQTSTASKSLKRHIQEDFKVATRAHTEEKLYSCEICTKSYSTNGNLKEHVRIHTGDKPYSCDICKRSFPHSGHLKVHMRHHTGEKPYICDVCDKSFSQSGSLKTHMITHTGEKSYYCDRCQKCFSKSGDLKRHMRVHTGDKPYTCDICDKSFSRRESVKKHMITHSVDKPHSCDTCRKKFSHCTNLKRHMLIHCGEK